jgi:hypothetical protein
MKSLKIQMKILLMVLFLNIYLINSSIGVGYITINMEGGKFEEEEYKQLIDLFDYVSSDKPGKDYGILNPIDNINVSSETLEELDFIMISIQESNSSVHDLNGFNNFIKKMPHLK